MIGDIISKTIEEKPTTKPFEIDFMDKMVNTSLKKKSKRKGGGIRTKKLDEGLVDSVRHLLRSDQINLSDTKLSEVNDILDNGKIDKKSKETLEGLFQMKKTRGIKLDFSSLKKSKKRRKRRNRSKKKSKGQNKPQNNA